MASYAQVVVPIVNPLDELQKAFCLITIAGEVRVMSCQEIADTLAGKHQGDLNMYQLAPGRLLMARHLETLPVSSNVGQVIKDFMVSPNTHAYYSVAFSPLAQPTTTLNYWVPSPVASLAGDWSDH